MNDFVGGSSVANPGAIAARLNGLHVPAFEDAPPNPTTAAPQQPPRPQPIMNPTPAVAQPDSAVEAPDFTEPESNVQSPASESSSDEDLTDLPDTPAAENFKKLRGVVKTERQAKRNLEAKLQETSERLQKFEKGEEIPDIIRAKDERIAQLEPYEKIVSLKTSKEYQDNYVEPAIELRTKLEKIGNDYGIPDHVMHELVGIDNRKDLNAFLSRHFDDVGGLEVKQIVTELHNLADKAIEAEKDPETTLNALKAQYLERQEAENTKRMHTFEVVAKDAWNRALQKTKDEGVYKELILHPTDTDFNKKVVEPIQHRASVQFGALVKKLAQAGLKELPEDLALGLARSVQLSIAGAMLLDEKSKAVAERDAVIQNTKRTNGYMRPQIGGQNGGGHMTKAPAQQPLLNPRSAAEAAARVFNK